ncbi:hypothetical protein M0813_00382 [Anaeramoeba flamelloides]|uniref:Uncharacterized protein n=1 Tax=Anaeramoeba flamelloides TaxID=1746091 RepID=A0AAV7Z1S4_9EUKA|nr:hypothetical protein M0812_01698 [Anaeramoeba flamelloides]KAJ6241678.1 hypothetical protein M0813_00382 [Anaeramoeba flamelloides]
MEEEKRKDILDNHIAEIPKLSTEYKLQYHSYSGIKTNDLPIQFKKKSDEKFQLGLIPFWLKTQYLKKRPARRLKPGKFMVLTESPSTLRGVLDPNMPQVKEEKFAIKLLRILIFVFLILDLFVMSLILFLTATKTLNIITTLIVLPLQFFAIYGSLKEKPSLLLIYIVSTPLLVPIQVLNSNSFLSVIRSFVWTLQLLVVIQFRKKILPRIIKSQ